MSKKLILPLVLGMLSGLKREEPILVLSHKIKQPKQHTEPSKRKLQKTKGKKARKNRGKSRVA